MPPSAAPAASDRPFLAVFACACISLSAFYTVLSHLNVQSALESMVNDTDAMQLQRNEQGKGAAEKTTGSGEGAKILPPEVLASASDGDGSKLISYLESGGDPNAIAEKYPVHLCYIIKERIRNQGNVPNALRNAAVKIGLNGRINYNGSTGMSWLSTLNDIDLVKRAMAENDDVSDKINAIGDVGSAMHASAKSDNIAAFKTFDDNGGDKFSYDIEWRTPLHYTVLYDSPSVFNYIVNTSTSQSLSLPDKKGNTPAHYAAMLDKIDMTSALKESGARFDMKNNDGRTASYYVEDFIRRGEVERSGK